MERVVPWPSAGGPGYVNLHWKIVDPKDKGKAFWGGRPQQTVDNLLGLVAWCMGRPSQIKDLYFCLSLQSEIGKYSRGQATVKRMAKNAIALKAIWLDVDVKEPPKGYASIDEALGEIARFVDAANLPPPTALVASGGGVHVYWISDRPLNPDEWMAYASGLKSEAVKFGLRCDAGVTTDSARILRVPGTANWKTDPPKPVRLLGIRPDDYDFSVVLADLATKVTAVVARPEVSTIDLSKFPKKAIPVGGVESLSEGLDRKELPPLPIAPIFKGCPFYADALLQGGKVHSQGEWNLAVLGTTFMENGEKIAHAIGNQHPGYTPDSTKAMYDRKMRERTTNGLGWPSCKAIQSEGCKLCATCPHFGKIKSPLHLALEAAKPIAPVVPAATVKEVEDLCLPPGFTIDPKTGFICEVEEKVLKDGSTIETLYQLFMCKLTKPSAQKNPDALKFTTTLDMDNTRDISISTLKIATTGACIAALIEAGVKPYLKNEVRIRNFLMSWISELHKRKEAMQARPFGWWDSNGALHGFVYGGVLVNDKGDKTDVGYSTEEMRRLYHPTGSIDKWFTGLKMITNQHRPELEVITASSFASPLMVPAGEYSGIISAFGQTSGFKSSALKVGLAVWGHPKLAKDANASTANSVANKMGVLRHLPIFWDEIRTAKALDHAYDMIQVTEGVEKSRLTSDIKQREKGDWQNMLTFCTNNNIIAHIASKEKANANEAGVMRVFEFDVPVPVEGSAGFIDGTDANSILQDLEYNYGQMGVKYAAMLGKDPAGIMEFTQEVIKKFKNEIGYKNGERYWLASCGTILAGAQLANLLGCDFHIDEIDAFLKKSYLKLREQVANADLVGGSVDNTMQSLTGWLRDAGDGTVWTDTCPMGRGRPPAVSIIFGPNPQQQKPIKVQWVVGDHMLLFSKQLFSDYLHKNNCSTQSVMEGLKKHFKAKDMKGQLCSGTIYRLTPERIVKIPVEEGSPLWDMMNAHTPISSVEPPTK